VRISQMGVGCCGGLPRYRRKVREFMQKRKLGTERVRGSMSEQRRSWTGQRCGCLLGRAELMGCVCISGTGGMGGGHGDYGWLKRQRSE
jgi:hypothetical protein